MIIVLKWHLKDKGTLHEMTKNNNLLNLYARLCIFVHWECGALKLWYVLMLKRCFSFNNHENAAINFKPRRNFGKCASRKKLCLFWSVWFYRRVK